jgi:hypothetical protein
VLNRGFGIRRTGACRLLPLSLFVPAIVTEILNGRQSSDVMHKQLSKPVSARRDEQMAKLRIAPKLS